MKKHMASSMSAKKPRTVRLRRGAPFRSDLARICRFARKMRADCQPEDVRPQDMRGEIEFAYTAIRMLVRQFGSRDQQHRDSWWPSEMHFSGIRKDRDRFREENAQFIAVAKCSLLAGNVEPLVDLMESLGYINRGNDAAWPRQ